MIVSKATLFPSKADCCGDPWAPVTTKETSVTRVFRNGAWKRSKQIHHARGEERFWHWSDQAITFPDRIS